MSTAFLFPGQGSQSVGMLTEFAARHSVVGETFSQASEALGYDLWSLVSDGPAERLNQTEQTQPAMLTSAVSLWRVWCERGGAAPQMGAGHSLGEFSALVCAGSIDFADAVTLVAARGRFMQECVAEGEGAIAAVLGLDDDAIVSVCAAASVDERSVSAVNFNAPGQVAIAGHADAVDAAITLAKDQGARRAVMLPMSVPVHCVLMKPAAARLRELLEQTTIRPPQFAVVQNADLMTHYDADGIREALVAQIYTPVRWSDTVRLLCQRGATAAVECGPGKILTGLNKRIDKSLVAMSMANPAAFDGALEALQA